jgi:small subunit ribosomal protein S21
VIEVKAGDIDKALLLFRREVQKEGTHQQIKRRETFVKPSTRRRAKQRVARLRRLKTEATRERQREAMVELRRVQTKRPMRRREKQ